MFSQCLSLIIDLEFPFWSRYFDEVESDEIRSTDMKPIIPIPDNIIQCLNGFIRKICTIVITLVTWTEQKRTSKTFKDMLVRMAAEAPTQIRNLATVTSVISGEC
ncbi:hypothetical protein DFQ28_001144 [Apophysomyces sp. BC1034]|nr:hypothetical protein DFQ30_003744 [Apophysomyces sp. BC1015]KAG0180410.1 hypothetical protein DFQ29_000703 [Apophysomyces sp. BC1021]KAG0190980.1 hypothetical protein DFQ28_001144 [Apophysomyces sp. BC1034]